jgi:Dolichyl-phosphate-mannose-protein mannosyltransferase
VSLVAPVSREITVAKGARRGLRSWRQRLRLDWVWAALTVIVLGGAVARLMGGSWGLPLDLNSDEWVIVNGAIDMAKRHSFEPPYFFRPDHVEMQLSNLAYLAYSHLFHGSSPETVYASDPAPFILISRTITGCFGVAMIAIAYLIGKRFTRVIGVLAAFLVAFFPPLVDHSHFASPDVPLTFAFMIVILACMRYLTSPSWGNLLLASLGVSVAIAIKYPGALGALMIAITVIVSGVQARAWSRILVHGAAAMAAVVGFLFAISPVLFTNVSVVVSYFAAQAGATHPGADGLGWFGNLYFYATGFATSADIILLVCFALGVLWSVRLRLLQSVPLWLGVFVWVILSRLPIHWERWALPMYLTPLLLAPIGAYYSFRYILDKGAARWLRWGAVGLGAVVALNLVAGSVAVSARYVAKDTQTFATDFAARGIDHTNTIFEGYSPLLPGEPQTIFGAFTVIDGRLVLSSQGQNRSGMRYVVLSSSMYHRYKAEPRYVAEQKFYALLDKQFPLLKTYHPAPPGNPTVLEITSIWHSLGYLGEVAHGGLSGPTIKVYEIPADRR